MNEAGTTMRGMAIMVLLGGAFVAGVVLHEPIRDFFAGPGASDHSGMATTAKAADDTRVQAAKPLWTCSMHPQVIKTEPGSCPICHMTLTPMSAPGHASGHAVEHGGDANLVMINPIVVQRIGIRTATVESRSLIRTIRVVGTFTEPEPQHVDINLRVSGWIDQLYADADGKAVEKGDPLFDLYSPELNLGIDELIVARKRQTTDPNAALFYRAARMKLQRMGLEDSQIDELAALDAAPRAAAFRSPMRGHITAKMVNTGSAVTAGTTAMRVANRGRMWAELQVYEQDLPYVHEAATVRLTTPSAPGRRFSGTITFIHPHLDMVTRTAMVRVEVANDDHSLREGMFVAGEIDSELPTVTPVVPREAVIDTGMRQFAFIWHGDGRFEPRDLRLGASDGKGSVQVLEGLQAGESVVVSGQFLLDSESRVQEAVRKVMADGLIAPPPSSSPMSTPSMPVSPTPAPAAPFDAARQTRLDALVLDYLALAKALGEKQVLDTALDATALLADARAFDSPEVVAAAEPLIGATLERQRELFIPLGAALIPLIRQTPPSNAVGQTLTVFRCAMREGEWIQDHDATANPFYATKMKACGDIIDTLHLKPR